MRKHIITSIILSFIIATALGQTMNDTIITYKATEEVIIDGQATEEFWNHANWHPIDQVWIPYGATMKEGDFEGRFKTAWDENYLYVLVEVVDDSLSDDYPNPMDRFYDDDCVEVFIDEDRSMGEHEKNYNAFAYHVSLFYDAIDLGDSWSNVNLKNNLLVDMDTIAENTYLWEMAFKMYDKSFSTSNPEASRVYLEHNKLMGFAIAYCDNDETTSRENFIGSMEMPPPPNNNNMYKNADHFGPLLCIDQNFITKTNRVNSSNLIEIFPIPSNEFITINVTSPIFSASTISVISNTGQLLKRETFEENSINLNIEDLTPGLYYLQIKNNQQIHTHKIIKQ